MKMSLLASAVLASIVSSHAIAAPVSGVILDKNNQPISNAQIHYHGKKQSVLSNDKGEFTIEIDANGQLHISKDNYLDKRIDVTPEQLKLNVVLDASAIESVVVYASGLHKNNMEMVSPVSVLTGEHLKNKAQATLGETLKGIPGVNSTYFGPVASSPIIRGMDGPRVKVMQNGLDTSDASRIGPDHATTTESLTADQIEVLRGPVTLLYGSGAIGGVVNVVDQRIPTSQLDNVSGAFDIRYDSASNAQSQAFVLKGGQSGFNVHLDASNRNSDNTQTPDYSFEHEDGDHEVLTEIENTFLESTTFNFGTSYIGEHFTAGFSFSKLDSDYGIPGHDHGHEDEHDHGHEEEEEHGHEDEEHEEHAVFARMEQERSQALFIWTPHHDIIEKVEAKFGYTDYQHAEIEGGEIGTLFKNDSLESRITVEHNINKWHGVLGFHSLTSDYEAVGEEAFTPASNTKQHALFILEERQLDDVTIELGARFEDYELSSNDLETGHDDHDHGHEEVHADEDEHGSEDSFSQSFNNLSFSAGAVYNFADGYSASLSLSHSQRAPSSAELLSNGIHIATGTYDLGAAYEIETEADGHTEIHFEPEDLQQETANNIDLTFRKYKGSFGFTANLFYNDINDYYHQQNTGYVFDEHTHELVKDEHEGHEDEHEDALKVYQFNTEDAKLYGFEFDSHYQLNNNMMVKVFADSITAKLDDDSYIPRIPANKVGTSFELQNQNWDFDMTVTHHLSQDKLAQYETKTDAYTLVDFGFSYYLEALGTDSTLFIRANNLTDELGFVHNSFIKDQAPLPGRNFTLGIRGYF